MKVYRHQLEKEQTKPFVKPLGSGYLEGKKLDESTGKLESKINNCPFCKGTPVFKEKECKIECNCGLSFTHELIPQLIYNWNYMTSTQQTVEFAIYSIEEALGSTEPGVYHFFGWVEEFNKFKEKQYGHIQQKES